MENYKLETKLEYFKYNHILNKEGLKVTWFVLQENSDEEEARGFNKDELDDFIKFINSNPENFPGKKNYFNSNEEDFPYLGVHSWVNGNKILSFPSQFFLRSNFKLNEDGNVIEIFEGMDIILTSTNGSKKIYDLPFNVVGVIR